MFTLKIFDGSVFPRYVRELAKADAERLAAHERSKGNEVEIYRTVKDIVSQVK